ncbi:hypothetical protein SLA2020_501040 [Shorea laevis]
MFLLFNFDVLYAGSSRISHKSFVENFFANHLRFLLIYLAIIFLLIFVGNDPDFLYLLIFSFSQIVYKYIKDARISLRRKNKLGSLPRSTSSTRCLLCRRGARSLWNLKRDLFSISSGSRTSPIRFRTTSRTSKSRTKTSVPSPSTTLLNSFLESGSSFSLTTRNLTHRVATRPSNVSPSRTSRRKS